MLNFTPLKYFYYKLVSKRKVGNKSNYVSNIIANETLTQLKLRYKNHRFEEVPSKIRIDAKNKSFDRSLFDILDEFGKPFYIHTHKTGSVKHQVLFYKSIIKGFKTRIVYNFIDYKMATISFQFTIFEYTQLEMIHAYIEETFLHQSKPKSNQFCIVDDLGNKLEYNYTFDLHLTFINNNREVIQNINSALYQHNFHPERFMHSKEFQLSV